MPTSGDGDPEPREPEFLVDTSVAVALSVAGHEGRAAARAAGEGRRLGLAGHAAFETYSVLTRLPAPARRTTAAVGRLLARNFPYSRFLSPGRASTRDRRALGIYRALDVDVVLVA